MLTCHLVMKHPLKLREIGGCKFFVHHMSHLYPWWVSFLYWTLVLLAMKNFNTVMHSAVDIHEPQSGWFKYVSNSSVWWLHLNWDRDRVFSVRFLSMLFSVRFLSNSPHTKMDHRIVLQYFGILYDPFYDTLLSPITYREPWFFITG